MGLLSNRGEKPPGIREVSRRIALEGRTAEAFARGDVSRALELGGRAAAILRRERADYDRCHPNAPRFGTPMDDA